MAHLKDIVVDYTFLYTKWYKGTPRNGYLVDGAPKEIKDAYEVFLQATKGGKSFPSNIPDFISDEYFLSEKERRINDQG